MQLAGGACSFPREFCETISGACFSEWYWHKETKLIWRLPVTKLCRRSIGTKMADKLFSLSVCILCSYKQMYWSIFINFGMKIHCRPPKKKPKICEDLSFFSAWFRFHNDGGSLFLNDDSRSVQLDNQTGCLIKMLKSYTFAMH